MSGHVEYNDFRNKPLTVKDLEGFYTALMTFYKGKEIDYERQFMLIDDQINSGVKGLVLCGTTAQTATMTHKQQAEHAGKLVNYIKGRTNIIIGAGSNSTEEAIKLQKSIEERVGPSTFLHVTPYYNKPTQRGIKKHFEEIASKPLLWESNIILYAVPSRTGVNIESETAIELSKNKKIIGLKYADTNFKRLEEITRVTKDFTVMAGEDSEITNMIRYERAKGAISATGNIAPKYMAEMLETALKKDSAKAEEMHKKIKPLVAAAFKRTNPIPLAHMFDTDLKLPLTKEPEIDKSVNEVLREYTAEELGVDVLKYRN